MSKAHALEMPDVSPLDPVAVARLQELTRSVAREGEDLLAHMVAIFVRDSVRRLEDCRSAWLQNDFDAARRAAHTLKGAAASIGAAEVAREAATIESAIKSRRTVDVDALERLAVALPIAHNALRALKA